MIRRSKVPWSFIARFGRSQDVHCCCVHLFNAKSIWSVIWKNKKRLIFLNFRSKRWKTWECRYPFQKARSFENAFWHYQSSPNMLFQIEFAEWLVNPETTNELRTCLTAAYEMKKWLAIYHAALSTWFQLVFKKWKLLRTGGLVWKMSFYYMDTKTKTETIETELHLLTLFV